MQAATCDLVSGDASVAGSDASIQIQQHKQHAIPQIMRDDEARVRIKACCLDESDIRMRNVEFPELSHPPYTPGYACSGVIEALGSESLHFKVGDEVLVLVPLDSKLGGCAEFTVQPLINMFLKPSSLSHEAACAVAWSGIQGMTSLHYQLRVKAGDRLLLCTSNVCTDLILSSLAGLFGAKLIVATHTPQAYALFTEPQPAAVSPAAASTGGAAIPPPMNPLAHILRVVDCSSANFASDGAVLAAVMEETGGLGVDGVIDLQHTHDPWNFLHMQHVTFTGDQSKEAVSVVDASADDGADDDAAAAASDDAAASAVDSSSGGLVDVTSGLVPVSASLSAAPLTPSNPISLPTLIACLGVHGRLLTSTPNLQLDPPLSRQLFLRGASVAFLFPHSWLLGATQRGRFAHTVLEILSLAAAGTLQPVIHSRYPLERATAAFAALLAGCPVGKIVVTTANK